MKIMTELVTMEILEEITAEDFIKIVDHLETAFHFKQPGYLDTELLFDDTNNRWLMLQHWDSLEHLKAASRSMFQDETTKPFRDALKASTVKMSILSQLKAWQLV